MLAAAPNTITANPSRIAQRFALLAGRSSGSSTGPVSRFAMFFGGSRTDDRQGSNPIALIATIILAPIAAMLIQAAISRSREFDADAGVIAGGPQGLVSALRKIEAASRAVPLDANPATAHMFIIKPFSASGLLGLFSTHPPTELRIEALLRRD